jgi:hypothetical protein
MTDEELKALIASVVATQKETAEQLARYAQEAEARKREADEQLAKQAREAEVRRKEAEARRKEAEVLRKQREAERAKEAEEAAQRKKEIDQQLKELGKQIGGLGEKFGSFTEGLALPSMTRILTERFGMEVISPSVRVKKQGQNMEIDVLAYANSDVNAAYVVEVKSHARDEAITQLQKIMERFHQVFPEHKDKKAYGILAAVDLSDDIRERILKAGFYVARIHDQVFELDVPANFQPKAY